LIPKTEIYYASRKAASAHVHITKNGHGKVRINNIPLEMIEPESAREVMLAPLEIVGDENRDKIDISIRVRVEVLWASICICYCNVKSFKWLDKI